ncbi:MAG: hypothetical protein ACFE0S_03090 [Rhodospirillales bacterium]
MSAALRIVVVNHVHPLRNHVSALRMRSFAQALAGKGDQVVLLSDNRSANDPGTAPRDVPDLLDKHDWSRPLFISSARAKDTLQAKAREGRLPAGIRQAVVAWSYFRTGGIFGDWRAAAAPLLPTVADSFKPDIVLATFGNTDAWAIADALAEIAGCPWIADFKDNWSAFIPFGFRKATACRFSRMAHMTIFSENHAREAAQWFPAEKTVIYSGYDNTPSPNAPTAGTTGTIVLTGSLYGSPHLSVLCAGIRSFAAAAPELDLTLVYAGNDRAYFEAVTAPLHGICEAKAVGHLPADELAALQASALANVYICNPRNLFQQKVLELLARARPVIAVPGESEEAVRIAAEVGNTLNRCAGADDIAAALHDSLNARPVPGGAIESYSWQAQTDRLREVMLRVIETTR